MQDENTRFTTSQPDQNQQTPERLVAVERTDYRVLSESDIERYYSYDLGLIQSVTHNGSLAGLHNPKPVITHNQQTHEVTIERSSHEILTIGIITAATSHGVEVGLFVTSPGDEEDDPSEEMTAIYLSPREIRVLRTLLNQLARGEERNVA